MGSFIFVEFTLGFKMNLSDILAVIGIVVGVAGFLFAIYQARERQKIQEFVRSQSWYVFSKANNVSGIAQASLRTYKKYHEEDQHTEVIELLAKTDAFGQDLFRETIRQIQLSEPVFTRAQITQWVAEGKLDSQHVPLFEMLCISSDVTSKNSVVRGEPEQPA